MSDIGLVDRVSALEGVIYTHGGVGERPNTRMHDNSDDIDNLTTIIDNIIGRLVEIESRSDGGTGGTGGGRTRRRRRKKRTRRRGKSRRKRGAVRTKHNTQFAYDTKSMTVIPNPYYKKPSPVPRVVKLEGVSLPIDTIKQGKLKSTYKRLNTGGRRKKRTRRKGKSKGKSRHKKRR